MIEIKWKHIAGRCQSCYKKCKSLNYMSVPALKDSIGFCEGCLVELEDEILQKCCVTEEQDV